MLDEDFRLYLIEVNTNPCLETDSPLLSRIIPELIESTFKLVIDPIFPVNADSSIKHKSKMQINQLPQEIKYQLIFDESIDGPKLAKDVFDIDYSEFRANLQRFGQDPNIEPEGLSPSHETSELEIENEETTNDDTAGTAQKTTSFDQRESSMEISGI